MRTFEMAMLRRTVQNYTQNGKRELDNKGLAQVLGLTSEAEKARMRSRLGDMVARKELIRKGAGRYEYNPKANPDGQVHESYHKLYRAVRSSKPGFSASDISQVSRVSYTQARRYINYLESEGFLKRYGRNGNTLLYRATQKARNQRETPHPPVAIKDPFESEKSAALRLVRQFMEEDLYQPAKRRKIIENCRLILSRFEKSEEDSDAAAEN